MGPEKLKEIIREVLKDVDVVVGYKEGFDKLHSTTPFVVNRNRWNRYFEPGLCAEPCELTFHH